MESIIPPDVDTEAVLSFSSLVMMPLIAGVAQVFVRSGLPIHHVSLFSLVLGVGLSVAVAASTGGLVIVGLVRGAVVGLAAAGLWMNLSPRIDTNGDMDG